MSASEHLTDEERAELRKDNTPTPPCDICHRRHFERKDDPRVLRLLDEVEELRAEVQEAKAHARLAFVEGAKWWMFRATGATLFASEVDAVEAEAEKRYPDTGWPLNPERVRAAEYGQRKADAEVSRLTADKRRCHALLQGAFATISPEDDAELSAEIGRELDGDRCEPGKCTDACDAEQARLRRALEEVRDILRNEAFDRRVSVTLDVVNSALSETEGSAEENLREIGRDMQHENNIADLARADERARIEREERSEKP